MILQRVAFAIVTAALLLMEITLTRIFSGTIGYYFAFMSISVAMLGLGAGSLWVTLRGALRIDPDVRAGRAALSLSLTGAAATLIYLDKYPALGAEGLAGQLAHIGLFGVLFVPFLIGGVLIATVFEAHRAEFASLYAIDLGGAALGCVAAVFLLNWVPAPKAMLFICAFAGLAAPLFFLSSRSRTEKSFTPKVQALVSAVVLLGALGVGRVVLQRDAFFALPVIRNSKVVGIAVDRWNDFSRVIVKWGLFCTWGLSEIYPHKQEVQFDLMIEGVAGTQIQFMPDRDVGKLDYLEYDIAALPHYLKATGSTLALGVGGGFDVMMAKHFHKAPIVGIEVNPLVGQIVNNDFSWWSGRPYTLPDVTIHFENARTFVKRDTTRYDVVTVTWVDSGAATGAGAFALTENYLYTVDAFKDYLARVKDDGILSFLRARHDPEYDAIKGVGIVVEALRKIGIENPERHIVASSVKSPHFLYRELTQVMVKRSEFTAAELQTLEAVRARLHFANAYTPGRTDGDPEITRLIEGRDRKAVYASFPFDIEPNTDDRPFYFFLRASATHAAGKDVRVLRQSVITIFVLIALFLVAPLITLLRRVKEKRRLVAPTAYFALLGLGFMLIEMKLLQQSILVVGNPTLSLAAVLAALLLSTGIGALLSKAIRPSRAVYVFIALLAMLICALFLSEPVANRLVALPPVLRTGGLVLAIAPIGILLGCPLPLGIATLGDAPGMLAWCWGVNGMLGVAGTAVAMYVAIHFGLAAAFLCGVGCYVAATLLYLFVLAVPEAASRDVEIGRELSLETRIRSERSETA
ncbi:MAG: hypothetical protein NVSMB1_00560 [Polyangiales bacterium]